MAGEDTAGWKRLSGCCGDLWIVEISGGAVIACSSDHVCKCKCVSITPTSNYPETSIVTHTCDNMNGGTWGPCYPWLTVTGKKPLEENPLKGRISTHK
jgi:hypothetical protein